MSKQVFKLSHPKEWLKNQKLSELRELITGGVSAYQEYEALTFTTYIQILSVHQSLI